MLNVICIISLVIGTIIVKAFHILGLIPVLIVCIFAEIGKAISDNIAYRRDLSHLSIDEVLKRDTDRRNKRQHDFIDFLWKYFVEIFTKWDYFSSD